MSNIRIEEHNGVKVVKFPIFDQFSDRVTAVYSTRHGGVSQGIYESMNLSFWIGDKRENVVENFRIFTEAVDVDMNSLVFSAAGHHDNIRLVTEADKGKGILLDRDYSDVDGLITNIPGIPLVTLHADCSGIYIYDPVKKAIGLAHAGWKGTAMEIAGKMIHRMQFEFNSNPADLVCAISPSICGDCYEIDQDVKKKFDLMSIDVSKYISFDQLKGKFYPDIIRINREVLISKGVKKENIQLADICTMTNLDLFFSHRGHHGKRGSQAAIMQLNK